MKLPDKIKSFITSPENMKRRIELMRRFSVSPDSMAKIFKVINLILSKENAPESLAEELKNISEITPENAKQIVLEFAGYEFLPISDYLGDIEGFIRSLGGNPASYPAERIVIRDITPSDLITEFLHEHPTNVPARLERRLREILESRVRNVRKDDETVTRLTRAEKIGGVELERADAEKLVAALAAKIASVNIASDNEPTRAAVLAPTSIPIEAKAPKRGETSEGRGETSPGRTHLMTEISPQSSKSGHGFTAQDEHEANIIRENILPKLVSSAVFDVEEEIKKGVGAVFDATDIPLSVSLEERYKAVVTSRLKGVRDAAETRDMLIRETAKGGLGFSAIDADKAALLIEKQAQAIGGKREEAVKNEKTAFVKNSVDATFAKDESRKQGELEELDRMYSSLTSKVGKTDNGRQTTENRQPIIPPSAPPIPVRVPAPTPVTVPASTVYQPVFRAPTTAPSPKMQDVKPVTPAVTAAPLTGPVQELANLTLSDFRRLSADPIEACRKLSDKLDILEEHAYTARIAGIQAWQGSDVYKRYLETINAAFSGGKPIAAAISDAMAAGRETPTEREVRAIMELNRQLKA